MKNYNLYRDLIIVSCLLVVFCMLQDTIMILLALPAIFVSIVLFLEIARLIRKKYFYDSYCEFEGKNEKRWKAMKWCALIIGVIYGSWVIYFIRAVSNWSRGG